MKTSFWTKLLDLVSPRLCVVCGRRLSPEESVLCPCCMFELPATDFAATPYVARLELNGTAIDRNCVTRAELAKGGELVFTMSSEPNRKRGISAASAPYSFSTAEAR